MENDLSEIMRLQVEQLGKGQKEGGDFWGLIFFIGKKKEGKEDVREEGKKERKRQNKNAEEEMMSSRFRWLNEKVGFKRVL